MGYSSVKTKLLICYFCVTDGDAGAAASAALFSSARAPASMFDML
jgi:hypothetical protein